MTTDIESQEMEGSLPNSLEEKDIKMDTLNNEIILLDSKFNRETLKKLGNKVRLSDSDDNGLELFCYVNCNPEDSITLHKCRGVVFAKEKIVMQAFPYTVEYGCSETQKIENNIKPLFDQTIFYDSYEGSLIRLFYYNDQWYTSTHRKLNAFRSKWASKESFGTTFKKALEYQSENNINFKNSLPNDDNLSILEKFQTILDKNKQYMFLVCHNTENRIVSLAPEVPTVYHVGTFVDGELVMTENCNIPYPQKHNFKSLEEIYKYVSNIDIRKMQGIICFAPNNKQYKIIHDEYLELFRARGNEPSIRFRYLQMRLNTKVTNMLYHLYPNMVETFDQIENNIFEIARQIYTAYVQRFIKKRFVTVPTEDFAVIRECHKWHEEDRIKNRINLEKVISALNKQSPTSINKMLRRQKLENENKKNEKQNSQDRTRSNTITSNNEESNMDTEN